VLGPNFKGIIMTTETQLNDKEPLIRSDKLSLDDAGRVLSMAYELTDEQLALVAGGMRGGICRIQTDDRGCGMNM